MNQAASATPMKLPEIIEGIAKQMQDNRAMINDLQSKITQIGYRTNIPPKEGLITHEQDKQPETIIEKAAHIHNYLRISNSGLNELLDHINQLL